MFGGGLHIVTVVTVGDAAGAAVKIVGELLAGVVVVILIIVGDGGVRVGEATAISNQALVKDVNCFVGGGAQRYCVGGATKK